MKKILPFPAKAIFLPVLTLLAACSAMPTQNTGTFQTVIGTELHPSVESSLVGTFPEGGEVFIDSPVDGSTVSDPWVDVRGTAPAETVVSLADEIAVAGPDGRFSARIPLSEGMNEILCIASDLEGNEVSFVIVVVYEKPGS